MQEGDRFELLIEQTWINFVVVDVRDTMPGIVPNSQFVVTSLEQLQAAYRIAPLPVTTVYIRAPTSAEPAIRDALEGVFPETHLTSQAGALAEQQGSPLIAGVAAGFRVSLIVAALYSALAVIVALVLTAAARARDLAFLRTLGLGRGQGLGVVVLEQVPVVLVAVLAGVGLGIGVAFLIAPGLDLRAFTGASTAPALGIDWSAVVIIGLTVVGVVALAVAVTAVVSRRRNLGSALRVGE